ALLIASRAEWPGLVSRIRALPPALLWLLLAYVAWMGVTTLSSTQRGTSATYVFGSAVTLGVAFLVIPSLANRWDLVRQIVATVFVGVLSTFSCEGWLIVLIVCGALAVFGRRGSPMARPMIAVALVMLVVFAAGITNVIGVNGRLDLTAAWYGPNASSVLLNPNPGNRGEAQTQGSTSPGGGTPSQRSLSQPCVAVEASGTSSGTSVQLKGTSSLFARLCLWEAAARAIAHRPLFGFGPGTGTQAIVPYFNGL